MKRKQLIIIGNMKMNMDRKSLVPYLNQLKKIKTFDHCVGIALPSIYLYEAEKRLFSSPILYGGQNCSAFEKGAYTGQVSTSMLKDLSCHFCLVGHSECRNKGEKDEEIVKKFLRLQEQDILPILCIGENEKQRKDKSYLDVLKNQLKCVLSEIKKGRTKQFMIAYEPIWAIGTGLVPSVEEIGEVTTMIKKIVADEIDSPSILPYVLYGGSVNGENIDRIASIPTVDGVLVGGACLKIEEFQKIISTQVE